MDTLRRFRTPIVIFGLVVCTVISIALHFAYNDLPCLNADEAAQGYNTYSVLKTGKDEYGLPPLRFLSFGENKLPLVGFLSAPLIALGGLNENTIRLPVKIVGILMPILMYFLMYKLYRRTAAALAISFLTATSVWWTIMTRHQHEAGVVVFATALAFYLLLQFLSSRKTWVYIAFVACASIPLYTYHIGKLVTVWWIFVLVVLCWQRFSSSRTRSGISAWKKIGVYVALFFAPIFIFALTELATPTTHVGNLFFMSHIGFTRSIEKGIQDGGSRIRYNKVVYAGEYVAKEYVHFFTPDFLIVRGDPNERFGKEGLSLISYVQYALALGGIILLLVRRPKYWWIVLSLLVIAPLPAALVWQKSSATRSFLLVLPLLLCQGYAFVCLLDLFKKRLMVGIAIVFALLVIHTIFVTKTFNFYFHDYFSEPMVMRAWQCGNKAMAQYVWKNYNRYDKFYITLRYGQPYIFLLFYGLYPPEKYQTQAERGDRNEFGFWEQKKLDKFVFRNENTATNEAQTVSILSPSEYDKVVNKSDKDEAIRMDGEALFYIVPSGSE